MTRFLSSFLTLNLILPPFFFVIIATLVLASFGKSLGIRNLYVKVLLRIFEVDIHYLVVLQKVPSEGS